MSHSVTKLQEHLDFSNGRSSPPRHFAAPYPVYGANGVIGNASEANSLGQSLVIGRVGSYCGSVYYSQKDAWVTDNAIKAKAKNEPETRFWYYVLGALNLNQFREGSGQPLINQSILNNIEVSIPEQTVTRQAIAHILGTLDDKIETNRKMNETLEAMARALFKSWFVDFDPVRKKLAGQPTGLPPEIDALFPGEFEDSALGDGSTALTAGIPKGWRVGKIREDVSINYGNNMPKSNLIEAGYPVYGAGGIIGYTAEAMFNEPRLLITCRGSGSGQLFETSEPAFVTNNSLILEAKHQNWRHYLREAMSITDRTPYITGSAQPQITIENLGHLMMMWPNDAILEAFHNMVEPSWARKRHLKKVTDTITKLRDTLLPKLISGELRVKGV